MDITMFVNNFKPFITLKLTKFNQKNEGRSKPRFPC